MTELIETGKRLNVEQPRVGYVADVDIKPDVVTTTFGQRHFQIWNNHLSHLHSPHHWLVRLHCVRGKRPGYFNHRPLVHHLISTIEALSSPQQREIKRKSDSSHSLAMQVNIILQHNLFLRIGYNRVQFRIIKRSWCDLVTIYRVMDANWRLSNCSSVARCLLGDTGVVEDGVVAGVDVFDELIGRKSESSISNDALM